MQPDQLIPRTGHEGWATRQHFEHHAGQRIHVGSAVDRPADYLLGAHVARRTDHHPQSGGHLGAIGVVGRVDRSSNTKVGDQGDAVRQQDVFGLDVSMHETLPVRVAKRARNLACESNDLGQIQLFLAVQSRSQRVPADIWHHVEQPPRVCTRIEEWEHVRVIQSRDDLDFTEKPVVADGTGQLGFHHLDGDLALVLEVVGEVDRGHAAAADLTDQAVLPGDDGAGFGLG